jgi:hypothetical protein
MSLVTGASLTLDRLQYTVQLRSVTAELAVLPGVNSAEVLIVAGVQVDATPGTEASLDLDGGDGSATVLTGHVAHVERTATGTLVRIADAGAELAAVRPHETYNGLTGTQLIAKLAGLAGVDVGLVVATNQTAAYVADPRRTAAEHVAAVVRRAGGVAAIDGAGQLTVQPWPVGLPTAALRLDREFVRIATTAYAPGHEYAAVGGGGSGVALAPDAWLLNTDPVTSADDPDPSRTWFADPVLRTALDVEAAQRAEAGRRGSDTLRLAAECWLLPARRPGEVVQLQQTTSDDQAGPWLLTGVRHELGWGHAWTVLTGVSGGDPGGLLGSLAGAIGGLL